MNSLTSTNVFTDGDRRIGVTYSVGDEVEVLNGGLNTWSPARITAVHRWGFELDQDGRPRLAHLFQVRQRREHS